MNAQSHEELLELLVHDNAELDKLEEIADEFNIFTALDILTNELRHSTFLAWLMNPGESHGLGDYFLASFLRKASHKASLFDLDGPSIFDIDTWSFGDAEVVREWRNIDILIRCDTPKLVCAIENKITTSEHGGQLARYSDVVRKEFPHYHKLFVYLTVEGLQPSESEYIPLTYADIVPLLEHLLEGKKSKLSPEILAFISHYKEMLRRYIMEDSEVQEICRRIYKRHKKALDLIFQYKPDRLHEVYQLWVDIVRKRPDLILDESNKSLIRFMPKNLDFIPKKGDGWTPSGRILLFEIYNHAKGIDLSLVIGPGPQKMRQKLQVVAQSTPSLFNKSQRNLTKQWFALYKKPLLRSAEYDDKQVDEMTDLFQQKFDEFLSHDLPKIEKELLPLKHSL